MSTSPMIAEAVVLLLKVFLWCAVPFLFRPLLARCSASTRHLLLTLTLAGALALPLLRLAAPAWQAPAGGSFAGSEGFKRPHLRGRERTGPGRARPRPSHEYRGARKA